MKCNKLHCVGKSCPPDIPKLIDFASLCLYYEYLRFISFSFLSVVVLRGERSVLSTKRAILLMDNNPSRRLSVATAALLWIILTTAFMSGSLAAAADIPAGKAQIQGGNLRIEFDNRLRSRVVARFDKTETVMGPFTASETVTTADDLRNGFVLTSQKHERTKDAFGEGERLAVEGKAGDLKKTVSVTVYDDFPAMGFFDGQYTNI